MKKPKTATDGSSISQARPRSVAFGRAMATGLLGALRPVGGSRTRGAGTAAQYQRAQGGETFDSTDLRLRGLAGVHRARRGGAGRHRCGRCRGGGRGWWHDVAEPGDDLRGDLLGGGDAAGELV